MTEHNHRRGTRFQSGPGTKIIAETITPRPNVRHIFGKNYQTTENEDGTITAHACVPAGYMHDNGPTRPWRHNQNIRKSFGDTGELSGVSVGASSGSEHSNGHRGEARAVRGAKKFVRSRIRFHENAATKKLVDQIDD